MGMVLRPSPRGRRPPGRARTRGGGPDPTTWAVEICKAKNSEAGPSQRIQNTGGHGGHRYDWRQLRPKGTPVCDRVAVQFDSCFVIDCTSRFIAGEVPHCVCRHDSTPLRRSCEPCQGTTATSLLCTPAVFQNRKKIVLSSGLKILPHLQGVVARVGRSSLAISSLKCAARKEAQVGAF